jgi:hypothetical protein
MVQVTVEVFVIVIVISMVPAAPLDIPASAVSWFGRQVTRPAAVLDVVDPDVVEELAEVVVTLARVVVVDEPAVEFDGEHPAKPSATASAATPGRTRAVNFMTRNPQA